MISPFVDVIFMKRLLRPVTAESGEELSTALHNFHTNIIQRSEILRVPTKSTGTVHSSELLRNRQMSASRGTALY